MYIALIHIHRYFFPAASTGHPSLLRQATDTYFALGHGVYGIKSSVVNITDI